MNKNNIFRMLKSKKADILIILAILGLIIGVCTYFGIKAMQTPEDRPVFIGEQQLEILKLDTSLDFERVFAQETSGFAVLMAAADNARKGGFFGESFCGSSGGDEKEEDEDNEDEDNEDEDNEDENKRNKEESVNIWIKAEPVMECFPDKEMAIQGFKAHLNNAMNLYLAPLSDVPENNYETEIIDETGKRTIIGRARELKTKQHGNIEMGIDLSFRAETFHDFEDYEVLAEAVRFMFEDIKECEEIENRTLNYCIKTALQKANNENSALAIAQLELHSNDCYNTAEEDSEELDQTPNWGVYKFCALKKDGINYINYKKDREDQETGFLDEKELEYWFGIDFGEPLSIS